MDELYQLMRGIKRAFGPNGILNPGKVCPDGIAAGGAPDHIIRRESAG